MSKIKINKPKKYFKITNQKENEFDFQFCNGLNVFDKPFNETGYSINGGFCFTDAEHIFEFLNEGVYAREILFPAGDKEYKCVKDAPNKWRSNKIILWNKHELSNPQTFKYLVSEGAIMSKNYIHEFCWAARNGYLEIIQYLVSLGANVTMDNNWPLCLAAENGHLETVVYLVLKGANIHAMDDYPLRYASEYGHFYVVRFLVLTGANVRAANNYAISIASRNSHMDVVRYFIYLANDDFRYYLKNWAKENSEFIILQCLLDHK